MDSNSVVTGDKFVTHCNIRIMKGAIASENQNKASPEPQKNTYSIIASVNAGGD